MARQQLPPRAIDVATGDEPKHGLERIWFQIRRLLVEGRPGDVVVLGPELNGNNEQVTLTEHDILEVKPRSILYPSSILYQYRGVPVASVFTQDDDFKVQLNFPRDCQPITYASALSNRLRSAWEPNHSSAKVWIEAPVRIEPRGDGRLIWSVWGKDRLLWDVTGKQIWVHKTSLTLPDGLEPVHDWIPRPAWLKQFHAARHIDVCMTGMKYGAVSLCQGFLIPFYSRRIEWAMQSEDEFLRHRGLVADLYRAGALRPTFVERHKTRVFAARVAHGVCPPRR